LIRLASKVQLIYNKK